MSRNAEREALLAAAAVGLGAGLIYFFDPGAGRKRREGARRALSHVGKRRLSDAAVAARVRRVLARSVSHPRSITVEVDRGRVVLGGPVIAREVDGLLRRVRRVRGVRGVRSRLEAHDWAADVPGLQGVAERPRRLAGWEVLDWRWPAGAGIVGGTALGALAVRGVRSLR
jgi:hypothetical protein